MAVGSIFTLFVVPAFYMLIAKDYNKAGSTGSSSGIAQPVLAK
jgi:multidrug efflux pump